MTTTQNRINGAVAQVIDSVGGEARGLSGTFAELDERAGGSDGGSLASIPLGELGGRLDELIESERP